MRRPLFTQLYRTSKNTQPSPWRYTQTRQLAGNILAVIDPRKMSKKTEKDERISKKKESKHRKQGNASSYKFVDTTRIKVMGGAGGKGCLSYQSKMGSSYKKRPDGGHGGHGGYVIIMADANEQSLNMSTHHYKGNDGIHGSSQQKHGRNGKDKIIKVPCGVVVKRVLEYDEIWDKEEGTVRKKTFDSEDENEDKGGTQQKNIIDRDVGPILARYDEIQLFNEKSPEKKEDMDVDTDTENGLIPDQMSHNEKESDNPYDFEEVVNTGSKSEADGMYHWKEDRDNSSFLGMGHGWHDDDELVSSSSPIHNFMEREKVIVADLDKPGSYVVVATGGRGGTGNCAYAKRQFVPHLITKAAEKSKATSGEEVHLELELKLIADIGLVGFPNAGKSSLLAAMSKARPEIAPYPFTTLHPLVGCIEYRDGFRALVADVPGLIDGAAMGRGRGHDFLKHLERTKALLYIVDAAGVDGRDPLDDLATLVDEIHSYGDGDMMSRPSLVVANKLDLIPDSNIREEIFLALNDVAKEKGVLFHQEALGISAGVSGEGLGTLSQSIRDLVGLGEQHRLTTNEAWEAYAQS